MIADLSDLSPRQQEVLQLVIEGFWRGQQLSYREIMRRLGLRSTNAVGELVEALCAKGYTGRRVGARGLYLTESYREELAGYMVLNWLHVATSSDIAAYIVGKDPSRARQLRAALEEALG